MAKQRNTNAASRSSQTSQLLVRGSTASDMCGLIVAVLAVAMAVTLLMPTTAPVAHAVGKFLTLSFGRGALLVPIALFLFSGTFFLDGDLLGTRVACGLTLCVTAVLSLVSLNAAGDAITPELAMAASYVERAGGYVGGGVAWTCLTFVGRWVGNVLLVGLLVGGIVICGLSLSGLFGRIRTHASSAAHRMETARAEFADSQQRRREERKQRRAAAIDERAHSVKATPQTDEPFYGDEDVTSFIGNRMTTVLTRPSVGQSDRDDVITATRVLHPDLDVDIVEPATASQGDAQSPTEKKTTSKDAVATMVIPDFLLDAKDSSTAVQMPLSAMPASHQAKQSRMKEKKRPATKRSVTSAKTSLSTAPQQLSASRPGEGTDDFELPPFSMLSSNPNSAESAASTAELEETMAKLQATLAEFGLTSRVVNYVAGPLVTTFQIEMGEGERVSRITNLEDDIALSLAAESVRIFAPIQGTSLVGIEIPNRTRQNVHLGDVLPSATGGPLEFALGRDAAGQPVTANLAEMPHLLVAGATGSGKSVMINALIMSLLMRTNPKQVRLILVDPKRVEFAAYNGLPHLYVPVVTEPRQAASALSWAVSEMERRLKVFERAGARNISAYNEMCVAGKLAEMENPPEPMPLMVIIIDELADLMMVAGKDVEASIVRIAQLARAAGIHLVLATQRPSANVVTGLIKSNIETRIALSVASGTDSRVILDATGAQRLLGHGDMLFKARGSRTKRVLGCYVSDPEIESVVDFIRGQAEPDYHEEILTAAVPGAPGDSSTSSINEEDDPLVWEAARIVVESQLGSTSGLQRRLKVGYARAGRIMDMLESKGIVGPSQGSKPRDVLLDEEGLEELRALEEQYREV